MQNPTVEFETPYYLEQAEREMQAAILQTARGRDSLVVERGRPEDDIIAFRVVQRLIMTNGFVATIHLENEEDLMGTCVKIWIDNTAMFVAAGALFAVLAASITVIMMVSGLDAGRAVLSSVPWSAAVPFAMVLYASMEQTRLLNAIRDRLTVE